MNIYKYAVVENNCLITIRLDIEKENNTNMIVLTVADNGKNTNAVENLKNSNSYGAAIISGLCKQIKAKIDISYNEGIFVKIKFPTI